MNKAAPLTARLMAEFVGTFCLVFSGTAAIAVATAQPENSHLAVSLVFGLVVVAMIYAVGPISGAHLNPAVTFGFWLAGRCTVSNFVGFAVSQVMGALTASGLVLALFGRRALLAGATIPTGSWQQSFALEIVLTFILMFVILNVAHDNRAEGLMAGVAVGSVIAFEAIIGGPISGASMNPARSFAPAVLGGLTRYQWIYWIAPVLGSGVGTAVFLIMQKGHRRSYVEN